MFPNIRVSTALAILIGVSLTAPACGGELPTATFALLATATPTDAATAATATPAPIATPTATPVPVSTAKLTPTPTLVSTPTVTPTSIPSPTPTPVPTATATPAPVPVPTETLTPTPTSIPSPTPTLVPTSAIEIRIVASADASLIEDPRGRLADSKDAAGNFVGMTSKFSARRLLVSFDLSGIPTGSTIASARLEMHMSRTSGDESPVSLHRFKTAWTEGSSDAPGEGGQGAASTPGDPTWIHASFDEMFWFATGGDYVAKPSATASIGRTGLYQWDSDDLTADVESWHANPSLNFGWIAIGDESRSQTAKRFDSRENKDDALRPALVVVLES